ncbi:MAG: FAD-binding protein [Hyphomicrobiaceae bacterium]
MTRALRPAADWELANIVSEAGARHSPLEVIGSGTKRAIGRPVQASAQVSTRGITGVMLYEPHELVMRARAGTQLVEIEAQLANAGQMLAFEPIDLGPLIGEQPGQGTIGSTFATNLSGARRIQAGSARDHLIGIRAVTGHGEIVQSGGRVMKNVAGIDVARGLAGSWGTLAVLTEVTFKVVPIPEETATLAIFGLPDEIGIEVLCAVMGTPYGITGAVHLQEAPASRLWTSEIRGAGKSATVFRLEASPRAISERTEKLRKLLKAYGEIVAFAGAPSRDFWQELRLLTAMHGSTNPLWRISTAPRLGPAVVGSISRYMQVEAVYDWSGGLIWLEVPFSADAGATDIRRMIALHGGHATLIRAEPSVRSSVEVFQPLDPAVDRLTRRLKSTFDPAGILNPGRMHAYI